ncbi:hypothetical protein Tco_0448572 [Tanacetum coccineum]
MVETLRVIRDMRREMSDMQSELLSLREQQRRARQPGPEARIPDHQDASRDADNFLIRLNLSSRGFGYWYSIYVIFSEHVDPISTSLFDPLVSSFQYWSLFKWVVELKIPDVILPVIELGHVSVPNVDLYSTPAEMREPWFIASISFINGLVDELLKLKFVLLAKKLR